MRKLILLFALVIPQLAISEVNDELISKYFHFLFMEDVAKEGTENLQLGEPIIGRITSTSGHRMIIISAPLNNGLSYYALLSENERNMGYLAWKARGFGESAEDDQEYYLEFDDTDFDYDGW